MRKIYTYKDGNKYPVEEFLRGIDEKLRKKLEIQLVYICDERNPFTEPYVKHFSIVKYRQMYEVRVKAAETMLRIIFYEKDGNIILLHAFRKRDRKDTEKALVNAFRILDRIIDENGSIPDEYIKLIDHAALIK